MTTKKKKNKKHGTARKILLIILVLFLLVTSAAGGAAFAFVSSIKKQTPDLESRIPRPVALTTKIFDTKNKLIASFHGEENREFIPLNKIPKNIQRAVIAIEDERFYQHGGIDYQGILRALVKDIKHGKIVEGGSTITQQLVKNRYLNSEKTVSRKVREAILAWQLEKKLTKKQILEAYMNTVYFGEGTYGVQTAADNYFKKPLNELTLGESATLAGLIRAPVNYSPYKNIKLAKKRRNSVIFGMRKLKMISKKEAIGALAEPLIVVPKSKGEYKFAPYFIDYVKNELIKKYGVNMVFKGGLRVYTTIDSDMQKYAEEAVSSTLNRKNDPSASLVAIEPKTGFVKAMVGGKNYDSSKFNLAVQGHRQAGSAFKIFVLSAAVENGFSLIDRFVSAPQSIKFRRDAPIWHVQNYSNKYRGSIPLIEATRWSDNSVFAQLIIRVGAEKVVNVAHRLGIKTEIPANPAIALGGLTTGVSALEMAASAATLSNDGNHNDPTPIYKITDNKGNLLEKSASQNKRAIQPSVARTVTTALKVAMHKGTGTKAAIGRPAAGKTGTAQDYHDAWFVGYTPNLATAVWMGYPNAQVAMRSVHGVRVAGGTFPALIWHKFMSKATRKLPAIDFPGAPKQEKMSEDYGSSRGYYKKKIYRFTPKNTEEPKPSTTEKPQPQPQQPPKQVQPAPKQPQQSAPEPPAANNPPPQPPATQPPPKPPEPPPSPPKPPEGEGQQNNG